MDAEMRRGRPGRAQCFGFAGGKPGRRKREGPRAGGPTTFTRQQSPGREPGARRRRTPARVHACCVCVYVCCAVCCAVMGRLRTQNNLHAALWRPPPNPKESQLFRACAGRGVEGGKCVRARAEEGWGRRGVLEKGVCALHCVWASRRAGFGTERGRARKPASGRAAQRKRMEAASRKPTAKGSPRGPGYRKRKAVRRGGGAGAA